MFVDYAPFVFFDTEGMTRIIVDPYIGTRANLPYDYKTFKLYLCLIFQIHMIVF